MGGQISQGAAEGRVAVITGGACGIGLAVAERCAALRMKVCIADLARQEPGVVEGVLPRLRDLGAQDMLFVSCDVSRMEEVQALHDAVYARWDDCGFLMNNAGLGLGGQGFDGSFNQPLREWELTMGVCLYGVVHGLRAFVPSMLQRNRPSVIVNTASAAGITNTASTKSGGSMAYTVAKTGVVQITESLDAAMRSREAPVSVHVLCPFGTVSDIMWNSLEATMKFKSEKSREKMMKNVAQMKDQFMGGFLPADRLPQILEECIEIGRFYVVTPDDKTWNGVKGGDINLARAWMLGRAEDFINDRPPLSYLSRGNRPAFAETLRSVEARAVGPVHKAKL